MVMNIARQMIERGSVVRAFMGVALDREFDAPEAAKLGMPRPYGARIKSLTPGAPAEAAKLQSGDVILEFNGVSIDDDDHLMNVVAMTEVGKEVPVVIWRNRRQTHLTVKVGNRNDYAPSPAAIPAHENANKSMRVARPEERRAWCIDKPRPSFLRACHPPTTLWPCLSPLARPRPVRA